MSALKKQQYYIVIAKFDRISVSVDIVGQAAPTMRDNKQSAYVHISSER